MSTPETSLDRPTDRKKSSRFAAVCSFLLSLLGLGLIFVHYFQFDHLAPFTLVPPWIWLVPAAILLGLSCRYMARHQMITASLIWLVFAIVFVEEARSLIRPNNLADRSKKSVGEQSTIRVVTLNCQIGSEDAAMEVASFQPDIVLLQESPGESQLKKITNALFGENSDFLSCGDASILARGKLTPIMSNQSSHFAHALVTLDDGSELDVVSLRLSPPVFRMDFWTTNFWNAHYETRQKHRNQLQEIVTHLKKNHRSERWILGGDFNLTGNDGALSAMDSLSDSFFRAGSGWGNTGTNDYPLFRVDQIWTNQLLICEGHRVFRTQNSDHRMVVADLTLAEE